MIVRQSSRSIMASGHYLGSPEGCGKLAGDNIPGNHPRNPRDLKGRWKKLVSCSGSSLLCPPVPSFRVLDSAVSLCLSASVAESVDRSRFPKAIKGYLSLPKPIQGFFEKVFFLFVPKPFSAHPSLPHHMTTKPANPKSKSTVTYRKSTVDLRPEPLIWGKTGLQTPFLPRCRQSFYPITTRKWKRANQKPTKAGQKINCPSLVGPQTSMEFQNSLKLGFWYLH